MNVYSIGFTKKSAETFFSTLGKSACRRVVDVRLNNGSQLAGFTKKHDLRYFLREICGVDYVHMVELAPTQKLLDIYRKRNGDWSTYERGFLDLMLSRHIEDTVSRDVIDGACLLCSEDKPHNCHRRLVAEYLREHWGDIGVFHLP